MLQTTKNYVKKHTKKIHSHIEKHHIKYIKW